LFRFSFLFFYWVLVFIIFLLGVVNFLSSNIIVWWSIFLILTMGFLIINKYSFSFVSNINYFVIQERLGLIFVVLSSTFFQLFVLFIKIGVSPFHFWIFSVLGNLSGFSVFWFLTFQKLPFVPVVFQLFNLKYLLFLLLGILLCYFQLFITKNYKNMVVLSSTESFNWVLLLIFRRLLGFLFLLLYYFIVMVLMLPEFFNGTRNFLDWGQVLIFINLPLGTTFFFLKIFSLFEVLDFGFFFVLLLLFLIFLRILSFRYWLLISRTEVGSSNKGILGFSYYLFFPFMFLCLIYYFSKYLLCCLDKAKF